MRKISILGVWIYEDDQVHQVTEAPDERAAFRSEAELHSLLAQALVKRELIDGAIRNMRALIADVQKQPEVSSFLKP